MALLLENSGIGALDMMAVSMPESTGLLIFAIGLVVVAVLLRSFFARSEKAKAEKESANKV